MICRTTHLFTICTAWLLAACLVSAQTPADSTTPPLSKYDIIQYVTARDEGPENIIELDNNSEILMACVAGRTLEQLKAAGLPVTKSQITLLKTWGVVEDNDGVMKTAFPILNVTRTEELRVITRKAAATITPVISTEVKAIADELQAVGRRDNIYCILFSYVADGLVWNRFEEQKLLRKKQLSLENPHWSGEVWALYPKREFCPGTNSLSDKGVSLKMCWSEPAIPLMAPFVADWKDLSRMFDDYVAEGRMRDSAAASVFRPFGLFDATGKFTWPVIEEGKRNRLYALCDHLARTIATKAREQLPLSQIKSQFGFRDEEQTLVIAYHELMWDLMDQLELQNLVHRPAAFSGSKDVGKDRIADLVFVVRAAKKDH